MGHVLEIANKVHLERAGGNGEEHFRNILVISNSSEESRFRREAISRADWHRYKKNISHPDTLLKY